MDAQSNPYAPPKSNVALPEDEKPIVPAGKGRRFGTFVIDYVFYIGFSFCFGLAVALIFGDTGSSVLLKIPDLALGFVLLFSYYLFFEGIWARTPGKFIFGTVVVNELGGRPSLQQVAGRTLCRFIPFEFFSCFGERGWHDSIPKTYVVLARASKAA